MKVARNNSHAPPQTESGHSRARRANLAPTSRQPRANLAPTSRQPRGLARSPRPNLAETFATSRRKFAGAVGALTAAVFHPAIPPKELSPKSAETTRSRPSQLCRKHLTVIYKPRTLERKKEQRLLLLGSELSRLVGERPQSDSARSQVKEIRIEARFHVRNEGITPSST